MSSIQHYLLYFLIELWKLSTCVLQSTIKALPCCKVPHSLLCCFVSDITSCWRADADSGQLKDGGMPQWVALAVVQSYNPRRKVPRGSISISDLELCISKASSVAAQKSGNIFQLLGTEGSEFKDVVVFIEIGIIIVFLI